MANSEEQLHAMIATLEGCRSALVDQADPETAQFVSLAILQLKLKLNQVSAPELKALCDAMVLDQQSAQRSHDSILLQRHRQRTPAVLKLVK